MPTKDILNWRQLTDLVTLSGQPTEAQLVALADAGVKHVINLGPHDNKGALVDETASVSDLGMEYIYIPVDFENPTETDFSVFMAAFDRCQNTRTHVHCIYNARVTAFCYRRACDLGQGAEEMADMMDSIWRPGGVWADFIGRPEDASLPNRYSGYDYGMSLT